MARRPSQSRLFAALVSKLTPQLQAAFTAAWQDMRKGIDQSALIDALTRGDIDGAIAALNLEPAAFYQYAQVKTAAFAEAGTTTAAGIAVPGAGSIGIRFDMTNPGAERWIAEQVGQKITGLYLPEQVETVRATILSGYELGKHPNAIARDIGGRVIGGSRQGGVLGLDAPRANRLAAIREGIKTPEGVADLVIVRRDGTLGLRYKVNKQTEARILAAYKKGGALSAADQEISLRQFGNALLKDRAETIARTETGQAVMSARREAWDQVLAKRNLPPEAVLKRWRHGGGPKDPRPHHVAMSGTTVRGLDAVFAFSNGASLRFALDPQGPASEVILCSCATEFYLDPNWGQPDV